MLATTCPSCDERYYSASLSTLANCPGCGAPLALPSECAFEKSRREELQTTAWNRYLQQPPSISTEDHDSSRVLVIDDDSDVREGLKLLLEGEGYRVEVARNGKEAIDSVTRDAPDLVLLDLMMPVMDGWQFSAALRESGLASALPVFVMTGRNHSKGIKDEVGAVGFLQKPFDVSDLLAQVAMAVR